MAQGISTAVSIVDGLTRPIQQMRDSVNGLVSSFFIKKFLIAFGVKGIEEYRTFTDEQKRICIREYLKTFRKSTKRYVPI